LKEVGIQNNPFTKCDTRCFEESKTKIKKIKWIRQAVREKSEES
jgi:hypothetical protein